MYDNMKKIIYILIAITIFLGSFFYNTNKTNSQFLGALRTFVSEQVGSSPDAGDVLLSDGFNSSWVATSTLGISSGSGTTTWGTIVGTLSNQTDLQTALNAKQEIIFVDSSMNNNISLLNTGRRVLFDSVADNGASDVQLTSISLNNSSTNYIELGAYKPDANPERILAYNTTEGAPTAFLNFWSRLAFGAKSDQDVLTWDSGANTWAAKAVPSSVTSVSGTTNRITSTGGTTPVIDISASYVGQSSITTLGTIGTGVWQGTAIADAYIVSAATWNAKESALTFSTGLTRAVNTITANLATGIAGGQSVIGGTAASENLTLSSTANATKGKVIFGTSAYDEVNNRLGLGTTTPATILDIQANTNPVIRSTGFGTTAYPGLDLRSARGTQASPTILSSSDIVGYINSYGYNGSSYINNVQLLFGTESTVSGSSMPGRMLVYTVPNGSNTLALRGGVFPNGAWVFGNSSTDTSGQVNIIRTSEQLRVLYDTSNYYSTTVGSTGAVTFNAVGSGSLFNFSDPIRVSGTDAATLGSFDQSSTGVAITTPFPAFELVNTNATANNFVTFSFADAVSGASYALIGGQNTDHANNYGNLQFWTRAASGTGVQFNISATGISAGQTTTMARTRLDIVETTASQNSAYFSGTNSGTSTPTSVNGIVIANTSSTTNNWVGTLLGDAVAVNSSVGYQAQLTDRTNHYGDAVIALRGADGYLERLRITGNNVQITAGDSTANAKVGGNTTDYFTDTSVGGAEADIYTKTLEASFLGANGDKVLASYSGNFVTVGTELTQLKVYFGGTAIWDSTGVAPTTGTTSWNVRTEVIRVSSTVVRYSVSLTTSGASGFVYQTTGELTGLTLSNTNVIKVTGTSSGVGSGAGDIVGKMGYVQFSPAN